ncbi:uncharacterized protein LOC135076560 [Ostrinia nubilalis]|uniref:uncharacterized protein LOC135076560 n=1 Tax=Ostrinia nubilalis TaxID=29057 RepID=UPI00308258DD
MLSAVRMSMTMCLQSDNYRGNREVDFNQGDLVLVRLYNQQRQSWTRGVVVKKIGNSLYLVQLSCNDQIVKRHVNQLLKYKGGEDGCCEQKPATTDTVPAFILPVEQSAEQPPSTEELTPTAESSGTSNAQPATNISPEDQTESNPEDWFDCGNEIGQTVDVTPATPPESECEPQTTPQREVSTRSRRPRRVVDYKKFF